MPSRNLHVLLVIAAVSLACHLKASNSRYADQLADAFQIISNTYIEDLKPRDLFAHAMDGMLTGLDQYSSYTPPKDFRVMKEGLDQKFGGVGIEVEKESDEVPILILRTVLDSPAFRAGLRPGDRILAIDGMQTTGMKREDAITKMRGEPGSTVNLHMLFAKSGSEGDVAIQRAVIKVESLLGETRREDGTWDFHLRENPRIGYLRLTTFGENTADELSAALGDGRGCPFDAIVLDLRNNAGGLLKSAVAICDLFVDEGRIVSTRGRHGAYRTEEVASPSMVISPSIPMVVLINGQSASASEIVAACLQDHGRAVVIGERSFGKGTVQDLFQLEGGESALKLTTATYWRPSGKNIHRLKDAPESEEWGVRPNPGFEVALTDEQLAAVLRARRDRDLGRIPDPTVISQSVPNLPAVPEAVAHPDHGKSASGTTAHAPPVGDSLQKEPTSSVGSPAAVSETQPGSEVTTSVAVPPIDSQLLRAVEYLTKQLPALASEK